ncbi:MAG TPA: ABC transporter ATP-binding protein [Gemmatimonadales bacterium]|nr:ABC transporter ATP-binding protein [Gemmatimonadales bacterium]
MLHAQLAIRHGAFALDLELEVPPGETLVLVGESGSGKSTVLRLLAGLTRPTSGRIVMQGHAWFDSARKINLPPQEREIGWLPQDYALLPHLDVFENVAFGLRARRVPKQEILERCQKALEQFGVADLAGRRMLGLSGGQQQRVALARAMVLRPRLLLLDEPLAALDVQTRARVRGDLRAMLASLSCTTIFVTHNPLEAVVFGQRIAVLDGGRIVQSGTPDRLLRQPRSPYVAAFTGVNLFQGRSSMPQPGGLSRIETAQGPVLVSGTEVGASPFVAVSPREITLYVAAPTAGSAQNVFRGPVVEMVPEPPFGERVRVVLGTRPPLVAEVTQAAVDRLGLAVGTQVYASFKATAVSTYS